MKVLQHKAKTKENIALFPTHRVTKKNLTWKVAKIGVRLAARKR